MSYELTLSALASPTRRALYDRLRRAPSPVGGLARAMSISQPAVSQHLRVLREAGLVSDRAVGTTRIYHVTPDGLTELRDWLEAVWDEVLSAYAASFDASPPESP